MSASCPCWRAPSSRSTGGSTRTWPSTRARRRDRVSLLEKALHVSVPGMGVRASFPVVFEKRSAAARATRSASRVPGSDITLVADDSQPHVEVAESFEAGVERRPGPAFRPAGPDGDARTAGSRPTIRRAATWTSAWCPSASMAPRPPSEARADCAARPEAPNHLTFVLAPGGALLYGATGDVGRAPQTGVVESGKPVADPLAGHGRHRRPLPAERRDRARR